MKQMAIRITDELDKRLNSLAKKTHRTKTFYVREAIEQHIVDLEETYLAEKALKAFKDGSQKTISLDDLERDLELGR